MYPLVFPGPGYKGQLRGWDSATCLGQEAYAALLAAAREGEVELLQYVTIRRENGQQVFLGPRQTTPSESQVKRRTPDLSLSHSLGKVVVRHREVERQEARQSVWTEEEVECPTEEEEEESEEEPNIKRKEEIDEKLKYVLEEEDEAKEEPVKGAELHVYCDDETVSVDDLRQHFEQYGEVKEVSMSTNCSVVTLASSVLVQSLAGRTHTLVRPPESGGSVPLRLRGGSGRGRRVPPRQHRQANCPFRNGVSKTMSHLFIVLDKSVLTKV